MVHQAIHIPDIAPNDVILVNNIPRFLTENGNDLTHSLLVIPTADDTSAPIWDAPHVTLTGEDLPWDPYDNVFTDEEAASRNTCWKQGTESEHRHRPGDYYARFPTCNSLETGDRIGAPPPSRRLLFSVSNMHSLASELQNYNEDSMRRATASLRSLLAGKPFGPQR
ncbi:hypothetical protein MHU86_17379 [Fragilaria crotonensis]|nr:hypothetical protein MHU86_17379 [Fragilaria crotonensis]